MPYVGGWAGECDELAEAANLPARLAARWKHIDVAISVASKKTGVGYGMIAAVGWVESRWNPTAVSSAGAVGIMQLMPATGAAMAKRLGLGLFDPRHPLSNILAGAEFLRLLIVKYEGKPVDYVYAAYFAGSGNVAKYGPGKYNGYVTKVLRARAAVEATRERCAAGGGGTIPVWPGLKQTPTTRPSRPSTKKPAGKCDPIAPPPPGYVCVPSGTGYALVPQARGGGGVGLVALVVAAAVLLGGKWA